MEKLKGVLCCYLSSPFLLAVFLKPNHGIVDSDVIPTDSCIFASGGCLMFVFCVFVFCFC